MLTDMSLLLRYRGAECEWIELELSDITYGLGERIDYTIKLVDG